MTNTTNDQNKMRDLGINPGEVSDYSNVSLEPVSFTKESDLGHSTRWCAEHSATLNFSGSQIEVEGLSFNVDRKKSQSFKGLVKAWSERMAEIKHEDDDAKEAERQEDAYADAGMGNGEIYTVVKNITLRY